MSDHKELVETLRKYAKVMWWSTVDDACEEAARVIEEQTAEIAELSDVNLSSMRLENGVLDMSVVSPMIQRMATAIGGWFKGTETLNYAEMRLHDRVETLEAYILTIQKASGKTPHQLRTEAENKVKEQAKEIEKLTKERDEAESVVRFIASDYLELSHHKVEWQRNDWRKRCVKFVESLYANKLVD